MPLINFSSPVIESDGNAKDEGVIQIDVNSDAKRRKEEFKKIEDFKYREREMEERERQLKKREELLNEKEAKLKLIVEAIVEKDREIKRKEAYLLDIIPKI